MTTCGERIMEMLAEYGIDIAFGIPGTHTIEMYRGLQSGRIRHVTPRHEQGAGFMADGYARITGRPALCMTVSGPGALNIATAMGQALQDSIPMLVISADNALPSRNLGEGRLHEVHHLERAMEQCSRWSHVLMRPDELPRVLARAFSIFRSERPGPVHITVPLDVITADASHVEPVLWPAPVRPAPHPGALLAAAERLNAAKRPALALGGGAVDAADDLRALAERLDAPVVLTQNAKGILPPDHPLYLRGGPGSEAARALLRDSDAILAIGTELGETDYDFSLSAQMLDLGTGDLIRVDLDNAQLTRMARPAIAIHADAALFAAALLPLVEKGAHGGADRTASANAAMAELPDRGYGAFHAAMLEALPDLYLVGDSVQPAYAAPDHFHPPAPRSFATAATGFGTLGHALPAAFGAKLGAPDRPIVALLGDGGVQFTINELSTAVQAKLPVAVVIWNNAAYEMIAMNFRDAGMNPIACDPTHPDFAALARSYGCHAERPATLNELKAALVAAQDRDAPTLIEVQEADMLAPAG
ncbi:5-guanidino-2-oxopentanoate decarboxylase [Roseovarius spongiae]|uniref:5-guanidino-2-oxopentanoate decarboxylase n=1 Tax=Roseovarius spongiae TaxID=2320272 RepID=A0A3A8B5Y2_9RHOB|nr:5-guanidino-2-oxopentanoate decarboxylase [Roseovarius spongiae]RKF16075.1 5-guanidino-2-oxopentanoate decarboxylase [Roseovarius spongiae]